MKKIKELKRELIKQLETELSNRAKQDGGVPVAFADGITVAQTIIYCYEPNGRIK